MFTDIKTQKSQNFILPWMSANLVFVIPCWSCSQKLGGSGEGASPALREKGDSIELQFPMEMRNAFADGFSPGKIYTAGITFQSLHEMERVVELQPILLALG